jgi:hypothetical protein
MMTTRILRFFLAALVATFGVAQPALAYLDPGTGSMIIQLVLGGLVGMAAITKLYWQRLKSFVTRQPEPHAGDPRERTDQT